MKKRLFSWFLALTMVLSSLPVTTAFAEDGGTPEPSSSVHFTKELVVGQNGQRNKIRLEAYTTGATVITENTVPTDIVLVLDQSGSMDDRIGNDTKLNIMKSAVTSFVAEVAKLNATSTNDSDFRVAVVGFASESGYSNNTEILTARNNVNIQKEEYTVISANEMNTNRSYYIYTGEEYNRIFYDRRDEGWYYQAGRNNYVEININNTIIYERTITTEQGAGSYGVAYNDLDKDAFEAALVNCTTENIIATNNVETTGPIGEAISKLDGNGATRADLGLSIAADIFNAYAENETDYDKRNKVVVFLTDGVPTSHSSFDTAIANYAVEAAKEMKDVGTHIFSMYLGTPSNDSRAFLQSVSSNYPDAEKYTDSQTQTAAASTYYSAHNSSDAIQDVFTGIVSTISTNTNLNESSIVSDELTEYFHLPEGEDDKYDLSQIEIYTVDKTEDSWADREVPFPTATASVSANGKTIEVTGFNFAAHCVTTTAKDGNDDYGRKLVIYIPIIPNDSKDIFGGYLPTNAGAGLYENSSANTPVASDDTEYDDVLIRYEMEHAERSYSLPNSTDNSITVTLEQLMATTGVGNNPVLKEMIKQLPDGDNNAGVDMVYTLKDLSSNEVVATFTVGAGKDVEDEILNITPTASDDPKWNFQNDFSANSNITISIPDGALMAEKVYSLTCELTTTNPDFDENKDDSEYTAYEKLSVTTYLEVVVTRPDSHAVHGVIDNGGKLDFKTTPPGSVVDNTYTEGVDDKDDSTVIPFVLKDGYKLDYIIIRTSDGTTLTSDELSGSELKDTNTSEYVLDITANGCTFQAIDVTKDIAIEVYTTPIQHKVTTVDDNGSDIMDDATYNHSNNDLDVFFNALTGYELTYLHVGTLSGTHTYDLRSMSDEALRNAEITLIRDNGVIVGGSVKVPMNQDNYVEIDSAKRTYTLTYQYYVKESDGSYKNHSETTPVNVKFGEKLPAPAYMPGYGSGDGEEYVIDGHNYTLSQWYKTHNGMDFYDVVDVNNTTMPAEDITLHAFWERNPDVNVANITVTKNVVGSHSDKTEFEFHAVYHEHLVGTAKVEIPANSEASKNTPLEVVMTDRQSDGFRQGYGSINIYEVSDNHQHIWTYDNTRYELKYVDGVLGLYKNGNHEADIDDNDGINVSISFTNSRVVSPELSVEKKIASITQDGVETVITYDTDGKPTNLPTLIEEDDVIEWTITVTNSGNAAGYVETPADMLNRANGTTSTSETLNIVPADGLTITNGLYEVPAGGSIEFTATYTVADTDASKSLINEVTVKDNNGNELEDTSEPVDVPPYTVTYVFDGEDPVDSEGKAIRPPEDTNKYNHGATVTVAGVSEASNAVFLGWELDGKTYNANDTFGITGHVTLVGHWREKAPGLFVTKTVDKTNADINDTLTYTITLENTGDIELTNIEVEDTLSIGKTSKTLKLTDDLNDTEATKDIKTIDSLASGDTVTLYAFYTVTEDDAGKKLKNTIVADPGNDGEDETAATSEETQISSERGLIVSKTVDKSTAKVGDTLNYTITLKNTGNVDLHNIVLADILSNGIDLTLKNAFGDEVDELPILAKGAEMKLYASYTVQASDKGQTLTNTVFADPEEDMDTVPSDTAETTIPSSSSGGGSSKPNKPKDPPALNKEDHISYIVGYPEDYRTGKLTDDESLWPVKPQANITRAEVASIFFRLLEGEVRDGNLATTNEFSDVNYGDWYNTAISTMAALDIVSGYPDGTFRPNQNITRAELATIAVRFSDAVPTLEHTFPDVTEAHWARNFVSMAYELGWVNGYPDGTFKPDQYITRAETVSLINRVLERVPKTADDLHASMHIWPDNKDKSQWYYIAIQEASCSHEYVRNAPKPAETWTQLTADPDWSRYANIR